MTDIAKLTVQFEAETAKFRKQLEQNNQSLDRFRRDVDKKLGFIRQSFTVGLGVGIGNALTAAIRGLPRFVTGTIEAADGVAKMADKLGLSVEGLQEYRFAAEQSGIASNTFDMAVQRLGRRFAEADKGAGEAKAAFQELGISTRDSHGNLKTIEQLLPEIADRFSGVTTQLDKNRLAQKLFDSEGVTMVNLLREQSSGIDDLRQQARDAGLVLSDDLVRGAEKANDQLNVMKRTLDAQFTRVFVELAPLITSVGQAFADAAPKVATFFDSFRDPGNQGLAAAQDSLDASNRRLDELRAKLARANELHDPTLRAQKPASGREILGGLLGNYDRDDIRAQIEAEQRRNIELQLRLIDLGNSFNAPKPAAASITSPIFGSDSTGGASKKLTDAQRELNKVLEEGKRLAESLQTPQEHFAAQIENLNALRGAGAVSQDTYNRAVAEYQKQLEQASGVTERYAMLQELIADVDPVAPLLDQLDALRELEGEYPQYADIITAQMFKVQDEIDKVNAGIDEQKDKIKDVESVWQSLGPVFSSAAEDAIVNFENLREVAQGFEKDLIRIGTRKLVTEPLGNAIGGLFSGGGQAGGGFLSKLFGFASGGEFTIGSQFPKIGGVDDRLVMFRGQSGENVEVKRPGQRGGMTQKVEVHFHGVSDMDSMRKNDTQIRRNIQRALSGA